MGFSFAPMPTSPLQRRMKQLDKLQLELFNKEEQGKLGYNAKMLQKSKKT